MSTLRGKERAAIQAKRLLKEYNIQGPCIDLDEIVRGLDIIVKKEATLLEEEGLSGLVKRNGKEGRAVILINDKTSKERQRFTLAHEIGHYLLHTAEHVHIDSSQIHFRGNGPSTELDIKEVEANYFAAELLMPREWLIPELKNGIEMDDDTIKSFAKRYKVSPSAMCIRLASLMKLMG